MSLKFWRVFAALGVPGVTLGVFYALFRTFSWNLSELPPLATASLVLVFLSLVFGVTLAALRSWRPRATSNSSVTIGARSAVGGAIAGRDLLYNPAVDASASSDSQHSVKIGGGVTVGGSIAGRDIIINNDQFRDRTEELALLLEHRAKRIHEELGQHFRYAPVREFLTRFEPLHQQHIEALRKGHLARAHEILGEIHKLSYELQGDEFWTRHHHEAPGDCYLLSPDAFQRGYLIEMYVGRGAMEHLVSEAMAGRYSSLNKAPAESDNGKVATLYDLLLNAEKATK
jgi:hypothetical protein